MAKPVHPAIVHFPIALLIVAYGLDALYFAYPSLPAAVTASALLPPADELPRLAYLALSTGLIAAIPAALSGIAQANKVVARGGIYEAGGGVRPKVKAIAAHAVVSDIVILTSAWVWWKRRTLAAERTGNEGALKFMLHLNDESARCGSAIKEAAYAAEPWIVGVEGILGALLVLASGMGGSLAYEWGVGLSSRTADGKKRQ